MTREFLNFGARGIFSTGSAIAILVLGLGNADANCGGNLSPGRTPFAILEPQTVRAAALSTALPGPVARAARAAYPRPPRW
jgi:hypothetical protein